MLLLRPVPDDRVDARLWAAFWLVWGIWALAKLIFAAVLAPSTTEALWVMNAAHMGWFYPDGPPGLALLAKLGAQLMGGAPLGLRLPVWIISLSLPPLVIWLAKPLVDTRQAVWAGMIALILPPLAFTGIRFGPDALLACLWLTALGFWVRALSTQSLAFWLAGAAAIACATLVSTFALIPLLGLVIVAFSTRPGRIILATPAVIMALVLALWGLLPTVVATLHGTFPPLDLPVFALNSPLKGIGLGIALVSPLMVYGLVEATKIAGLRARARDARFAAVLAAFLSVLLITLITALWGQVLTMGWVVATAILACLMPAAAEAFLARATGPQDQRLRLSLTVAAPILGLLTIGLGALHNLAWLAPERVLPASERWRLQGSGENWTRTEAAVQRAIRAIETRGNPAVVVVQGRDMAAHIGWQAAMGRDLFVAATKADIVNDSAHSLARWRQDDDAMMAEVPARVAVLILPRDADLYRNPEAMADRVRLCQRFSELQPFEVVHLAPGRAGIEIYTGVVRATPGPFQVGCPLFPSLMITTPTPGAVVSAKNFAVEGIAAAITGIVKLEVMLDGQSAAIAHYGFAPEGLTVSDALMFDPKAPKIGFATKLDGVTLGRHRISIRATRTDGIIETGPEQTVYVR